MLNSEYKKEITPVSIKLNTSRSFAADKILLEVTAKPNKEFTTQYAKVKKTRDIIFLLDTSGSMRNVYEKMMEGVVNAINQLGSNDRFSVLLFDTHCKVICKKVLKSNTELVNECITKILAPVAFGGTCLDTGFAEVIKILREDDIICENTTFITLTDGDTENYRTCVQQLTELNKHFKGKLPNCWMIGAGSDYNANNVTGLAKLMKASFVYVEMSDLKDFFTKHVKLTAGIYVDFNLIEVNTKKRYGIKHKLINFTTPTTFLACFEIEVDLLGIKAKNINFIWQLESNSFKTLTNNYKIEPYRIQFRHHTFARYLNNQVNFIYNNSNLTKQEKLQKLEEILPYAKILDDKKPLTLITGSIQRLNPKDNCPEKTSEAEFQSVMLSCNAYDNPNYILSQQINKKSFQKISIRTFDTYDNNGDSPILTSHKRKRRKKGKKRKKQKVTTFDNYEEGKKIVNISREKNFITTDQPSIMNLDGPSDLEKILLHTGKGDLHDLLKTLTEKTFSKHFNKTKNNISTVKKIITETMLKVGELFPIENRQEEKVIKLVQTQMEKFRSKDANNAIPSSGDYIRNKTGVAPQFSVITAFLIGGLALDNKLPGLNSGSKLFHYRDTALTFKFHSWVIYNCRINDISHLLLIDSFYCKIFDLSIAKDAKEALAFYKEKGLKGILRNLYTADARFKKFELEKHYQLDSTIPKESLDCVPKKNLDKFKNKHFCPITHDVMLDPVMAIHKTKNSRIKYNVYGKKAILEWKKYCKDNKRPFTDPLHRQIIIKLVPCFRTSSEIFDLIVKYHVTPKKIMTNYEGYKKSYIEEKFKTNRILKFGVALSKLKKINNTQQQALKFMFDPKELCLQIKSLCINKFPHKMEYFTLILNTALSLAQINFKNIEEFKLKFKYFIILTNDPLLDTDKKALKITSFEQIEPVFTSSTYEEYLKNIENLINLINTNSNNKNNSSSEQSGNNYKNSNISLSPFFSAIMPDAGSGRQSTTAASGDIGIEEENNYPQNK